MSAIEKGTAAAELPGAVKTTANGGTIRKGTETYSASETVYKGEKDRRGADVLRTGGINGAAPAHDYHFV